jgi:DegV family protein with EDD domain
MRKVAICIDSTTRMTGKDVEKYNVEIIPLTVIFDDGEYLDGIELTTTEFFHKLTIEKMVATTSQPSPGRFEEVFRRLLETHDQVLFISISTKLSGTFHTASSVAMMMNEEKENQVLVYDSKHTAGIGVDMGIKASVLADQGYTASEIIDKLDYLSEQSKLYIIIDDLTHLYRMGRIGRAANVLGKRLRIKPILTLVDGEIAVHKKVRTIKKTVSTVVDELKEQYHDGISISIINGHCDDLCDYAYHEILKFAKQENIRILEGSAVIAAHTGPNALGICWTDIR